MRWGRGIRLVVLAALAAGLVACGDEGSTSSEVAFDRADLERLVPSPADAPAGTAANKQMLGYGALGDEKAGRRQLRALRAEGLEDSYLIQFVPDGGRGDDLFVESMAFLFSDTEAAQRGLELIREQNAKILPPANELSSAELGEDAWGVSGEYGAAKQATATFGVRTANVVQTSTYAGLAMDENIGEAERLAKQQQAAAAGLE